MGMSSVDLFGVVVRTLGLWFVVDGLGRLAVMPLIPCAAVARRTRGGIGLFGGHAAGTGQWTVPSHHRFDLVLCGQLGCIAGVSREGSQSGAADAATGPALTVSAKSLAKHRAESFHRTRAHYWQRL